MSNRIILIGIVALVVIAGIILFLNKSKTSPSTTVTPTQEATPTTEPTKEEKSITVPLKEENKSGESGTATLTEKDGKVVVTLDVTGGTTGVSQPAHIHMGKCPGVSDIKYPLNPVVDGKSETTINATLSDIMNALPLAVNVHKSAAELKVYVACGEISAPGGIMKEESPTQGMKISPTPTGY